MFYVIRIPQLNPILCMNVNTNSINNGTNASSINNRESFITKKIIPAAVAGFVGVQTYVDYKNAKPEDKKNIIINDLLIGAAMIIGGTKMRSFIEKGFEKRGTGEQLQEAIEALTIPIGAGLAGGLAGEIGEKFFPIKEYKREELLEKAGVFQNLDFDTINYIGRVDAIGAVKSLDGTLNTMVGYTVGKEKGIKNKVKTFIYEFVSGSIFPAFVVIPFAAGLNKISPNLDNNKTIKNFKMTVITAVAILSAIIGKKTADWVNDKITNKVLSNKVWDDISKTQTELYKKVMLTSDGFEKFRLMEEIRKLGLVKTNIKHNPPTVGLKPDVSGAANSKQAV